MAAAPDGYLIEFGVGCGDHLRRLASRTTREIWGFDSFWGLPEDWDEWDRAGAFSTFGEVPVLLPPQCRLVAGLIQTTLPVWLERHMGPIAFVHFDLDLYSATSFALMTCKDRFADGAILLFDEIVGPARNVANEGRAFEEFLSVTGFSVESLGQMHGESAIYRLWL